MIMDLKRLTGQLDPNEIDTEIKISKINLTTISAVCDSLFYESHQLPGVMQLYPLFRGSTSKAGKEQIKEYYQQWYELTITPWIAFLLKQIAKKGIDEEVMNELKANLQFIHQTKETLSHELEDILSYIDGDYQAEIEELTEERDTLLDKLQQIDNEICIDSAQA